MGLYGFHWRMTGKRLTSWQEFLPELENKCNFAPKKYPEAETPPRDAILMPWDQHTSGDDGLDYICTELKIQCRFRSHNSILGTLIWGRILEPEPGMKLNRRRLMVPQVSVGGRIIMPVDQLRIGL